MDTAEREARRMTTSLCARLRKRGDADSLDAAAMIEGHIVAFADVAAEARRHRQRADELDRNHQVLLRLWCQVPQHLRMSIAHGRKSA